MAQSKQKCITQTREQVYIPPLNLPSSPTNNYKNKETLAFFKTTPLDQNAEFLKEKSLYRYTISRKLNRNQLTKSQSHLQVGLAHQQSKGRQEKQSNLTKIRGHSKEKSFQSGNGENQDSKQRHFKRKNRKNLDTSFSNVQNEPNQQSVNHQLPLEIDQDYCKSNNNKLKNRQVESNNANPASISHNFKKQNYIGQQTRVESLQKDVNRLNQQNKKLHEIIKQKDRQLEIMQDDLKVLKRQNERLIFEAKRNILIHSQNFINDHKLQNQLILRDNLIQKLQTNMKYMELENITLKKLKNQCLKQTDIIHTLEKDKKILEEKISVLYRQRTKRNRMKASLISQWSDLSLNLSLDQEEADKLFEVLKTAERTPQKIRPSSRTYTTSLKNQGIPLVSPLRRSKQQKV